MGVPSIFPNNGGILEFFPKNYKLMYTCLSDEELLKKLKYLDDLELLTSIGKENRLFSQKLLNENNYIQNFSEILNHE